MSHDVGATFHRSITREASMMDRRQTTRRSALPRFTLRDREK
jgi:hypothetical protein